ncbi:MAG: hypothetical protein M1819_005399 [Sarea resinae]|nr:MAG: hypothetical protein M1819_005399 [Sarea resinae]
MTEDAAYRTSTQYRLWSFTPESLSSLRKTTNSLACARVKAAIKRAREARAAAESNGTSSISSGEKGTSNGSRSVSGSATPQATDKDKDIECLSVEEEQKLVGFYCVKAMELADFCGFPTNVKATALTYLHRFYLSNSPMTYHPKTLMPSILFLATKTENHYTPLTSFASKLPKTTPEEVVAPEFLVTQGLRFTFDVRHPLRALEGGLMELLALAKGTYVSLPHDASTGPQLKEAMERTLAGGVGNGTALQGRIRSAYEAAKQTLKTSALLTDAYFLYTPSQIFLASLLLADEALTRFYLDTKFASTESGKKTKIMTVLRSCTTLLSTSVTTTRPSTEELKELKRIDKKLYACRNPEKIDLVGLNAAVKRGGGDGADEERAAKKRKLEIESKKAGDLFGPALVK